MSIFHERGEFFEARPSQTRWTRNRMLAAAGLVAALVLGQPPAARAGSTNSWIFPTSANPVSPVGGGPATATVATGPFATGWLYQNSNLGNATGVWDLGRNGTITLTNLAGLLGGPGSARSFTISVVQYNDGGIYSVLATISIPGAQCVLTNQLATIIPSLSPASGAGRWVVNQTQWTNAPGAVANTAVITSAYYGSLVNQVSLVSSAATSTPELAIQRRGPNQQQLQISWPASLTNQLQATSDLSHPQWTAVTATVQVNGNVNSVTINATNTRQFYRLTPP
jgi:hypothetical protein